MPAGRPEFFPGSADFRRLQTSATGSAWVKLANEAARQVSVKNATGTSLRLAKGDGGASAPTDAGNYIVLADGDNWLCRGLADAAEIYLKRHDESNTQVTVELEVETW